MTPLNILSLNNLLEDKLSCLMKMLRLTQSQSTSIRDDEIENLESLIDKKSELIDKIDALDYKFKDELGDNKIEDATLLSSLAEIESILKKIKQIDDKNNEDLSNALSDMKGNLKDVRQGQRAMKNYGNSAPYQSFASLGGTLFIDQDS